MNFINHINNYLYRLGCTGGIRALSKGRGGVSALTIEDRVRCTGSKANAGARRDDGLHDGSCWGAWTSLENVTIASGSQQTCAAGGFITVGATVVIENNATLESICPVIRFAPGYTLSAGGVVNTISVDPTPP